MGIGVATVSLPPVTKESDPSQSNTAVHPPASSAPPSEPRWALQQRLSEAQTQSSALQQKILELEQRNEGLVEAKCRFAMVLERAEQDIKGLQEEKVTMQQQNETLQAQLVSLLAQHNQAADFEQSFTSLRVHIATLQSQNVQLQSQNTALCTENATLQVRIAESDRTLVDLERQRCKLQLQNSAFQDEKTSLQTRFGELERQVPVLQDALRNLENCSKFQQAPPASLPQPSSLPLPQPLQANHDLRHDNNQLRHSLAHSQDRCRALEKRLEVQSGRLEEEMRKTQGMCGLANAYSLLDQLISQANTGGAVPKSR